MSGIYGMASGIHFVDVKFAGNYTTDMKHPEIQCEVFQILKTVTWESL